MTMIGHRDTQGILPTTTKEAIGSGTLRMTMRGHRDTQGIPPMTTKESSGSGTPPVTTGFPGTQGPMITKVTTVSGTTTINQSQPPRGRKIVIVTILIVNFTIKVTPVTTLRHVLLRKRILQPRPQLRAEMEQMR